MISLAKRIKPRSADHEARVVNQYYVMFLKEVDRCYAMLLIIVESLLKSLVVVLRQYDRN